MPKHWSYSSLINFEACPHRLTFPFKRRNSEAAQRGIDIHSSVEQYLRNDPVENPFPELPLERVKGMSPMVEQRWLFDQEWKPVETDHWVVIKPDVVYLDGGTAVVVDVKTGKIFGNEIKHGQQVQLYACAALEKFPGATFFRTELWYVDHNKVVSSLLYTPDRLRKMRERWSERGHKVTTASRFDANPSKSNCKYCDFREECEFRFDESLA